MSIRNAWCLAVLAVVCCGSSMGDTFFVYVEDGGIPNSQLREGLLEGLFERDHIVFDDPRAIYRITWDTSGLKPLIDLASEGGAEYLLAVRVSLESEPISRRLERAQATAIYFFIAVKQEILLARGVLVEDNAGREENLSSERVRYLLGERLSGEIEKFLINHYNGASDIAHLGEKALISAPKRAENSE